jgi:hypothetical protein
MIVGNIEHTELLGYALFGFFILAFGFGNIFYGISLLPGDRMDRALASLLLLWGLGNLTVFANEFWGLRSLENFLEPFNFYYQPLVRALIGVWLVRKARQMKRGAGWNPKEKAI